MPFDAPSSLLISAAVTVTPSNIFISAALDVTNTPPSFKPLVPSCDATSKSFVPSLTVTSPFTVNPLNSPTLVNDELVISLPNALLVNTVFVLILYAPPVSFRSMPSVSNTTASFTVPDDIVRNNI